MTEKVHAQGALDGVELLYIGHKSAQQPGRSEVDFKRDRLVL